METFVFTLRLQQLRCCALVFRLQTHQPRKRTVAECVLSLRQLGPVETQHWMELNPLSKTTVSMDLYSIECLEYTFQLSGLVVSVPSLRLEGCGVRSLAESLRLSSLYWSIVHKGSN